MNPLIEQLRGFGALSDSCVDLRDRRDARSLRYTDLVRNPDSPLIDVVVEQQSQALLYLVDHSRMQRSYSSVNDLQRMLAMRGEAAWLGVMQPGRLDIYATDLKPNPAAAPVYFLRDDSAAVSVLPRLAQGEDLAPVSSLRLRDELLRLMTDAGEELRNHGLSTRETIALTGRALFFRYLIGRGIVRPKHLNSISPSSPSLEACFDSGPALAATNHWLDETFNGDLLALPTADYDQYFGSLIARFGQGVSRPLSAIMALDTGLAPGVSQLKLDWKDLNFDHLPIGLLSETYEELMYRFNASARHATSVYYTPYHIAEYMVEEAFYQHEAGSTARVLDPACGAGVFLVASFRKLVELRFNETGKRPSRRQIRSILEKQLIGFDTNAHARTLASLALYLTALELDPNPAPVEALKFNKLEGQVLIDVADPGCNKDDIVPMVGSLGEHVSEKYKHAFDLVIGNPPWTGLTKKYEAIDTQFTQRCRSIAAERGLDEIAASYHNPDRVPDLPFVWGAMAWAKPGGRIALAVAGRWLFKQSTKGVAARRALFNALAITGLLNGAAIRQTRVWPNVDQPFCLLFADNRVPESDDEFVFVSPYYEPTLNNKGIMRVDASDARPVSFEMGTNNPIALKALYRGTVLDVAIVDRVRQRAECSIESYWNSAQNLHKSQGFQVASRSLDDTFLLGMPTLQADYQRHPFRIIGSELEPYQPQGLHRPRDPAIYKAPLLLVRKALRADRNRGRALVSAQDIAYSESYYGYSAAGHTHGVLLTRYLLVLLHSQLFEYITLMTSGEFGVEREAQQVIDIDQFPFIPPERLTPKQQHAIEHCAEQLINNQPDWAGLDRTVSRLYDLSATDQQVIADTLATSAPFPIIREQALAPVTNCQQAKFLTQLEVELSSVFTAGGHCVRVLPCANEGSHLPWQFFTISLNNAIASPQLPEHWVSHISDLGTSRITLLDHQQASLTIGLLNHYRYWTLTQARLLASDIIWQFGASLEERAQ